jgi:molybdenum cofactor cytidylyltransferase
LFMVSDQPFVSASLLNRICQVQEDTHAPIVSSQYADRLGVPVLFHKSLFDQLMYLQGDAGARTLIEKYKDQVATVVFPQGAIDVDTQEEYNALME